MMQSVINSKNRMAQWFAAVKMRIPPNVRSYLLYLLSRRKVEELEAYRGKRKIFVFLAGFYQNLGDMALTYAQIRFLAEQFPEYEVVAIPSIRTYPWMKAVRSICGREDLITILGGGNMDDIYVSLEDARRFVIRCFPHNKIVSFPQTIAFSDTPFGQKRLGKTIRTYGKHPDLTLFARERASLAKMQTCFPGARIGFCPDIVLSLRETFPVRKRDAVLCCLRNDAETRLAQGQNKRLRAYLAERFPDLLLRDTVDVSKEECMPDRYINTLHAFWDLLLGCKLVVTDRLHCMIFCVLTGTPCVVMDNSNRKISGVFDAWLRDANWIRMLDTYDMRKIRQEIDYLLEADAANNIKPDFSRMFQVLADACGSAVTDEVEVEGCKMIPEQ